MTGPEPRRLGEEHRPFEELAVGFALAALEPEEEQEFARHLQACARCERDVAVHRETLAHLAYAAEPGEPPAGLFDAVRRQVEAEGGSFAEPAPLAGVPTADRAPSSDARVLPLRRRLAGLAEPRRAVAWTGAAAAVAMVLSLLAWNTSLVRERDAQEAWSQRLAATVQSLELPDTRSVPLADDSGRVVAVALVTGEQMSLVVDGLPPNDAERSTYVLWGRTTFGDVRAVGGFDVHQPGLDVLQGMRLEAGAGELDMLMVTREPGREVPALATSPLLATGEV